MVAGLYFPGLSQAQQLPEPIVPEQAEERLQVLPSSVFLLDESNQMSAEEVLLRLASGEGQAAKRSSLNLGLTQATSWFYFSLSLDEVSSDKHWYLNLHFPNFDELKLYQITRNSRDAQPVFQEVKIQHQFNLSMTDFNPPHLPLFLLEPSLDGVTEYLLKARTEETMLIKAQVLTERALLAESRQIFLMFGLYLGVIGLIAAYNLILWLGFRDRSYLWFAVLITSLAGVFVANRDMGLSWSWLYDREYRFIITFALLTLGVLAALRLNNAYLKLKQTDPASYRHTQVASWATVVSFILMLFIADWQAILITTLVGLYLCFVLLFSSFRAFRLGREEAKYIAPAWIVFVVGLVLHAGVFNGYVAFNFWTLHSLQIASVVQAFILSFALSDRISQLNKEREQLSADGEMLRDMVDSDTLTGLYNKRYCNDQLRQLFDDAKRFNLPLSLLIIDIDHFKAWNDNFGHLSGDKVLQQFGGILNEHLRPTDIACRYGGEEFVILLNGTEQKGAVQVAERIRHAIQDEYFESNPGEKRQLTVSIGVAEIEADMTTPEDLLSKADQAMYRGKREGRNRTVL